MYASQKQAQFAVSPTASTFCNKTEKTVLPKITFFTCSYIYCIEEFLHAVGKVAVD